MKLTNYRLRKWKSLKNKKNNELEEMRIEKGKAMIQLTQKIKEVESLNKALFTCRKENKILAEKWNVDSETSDHTHLTDELVKVQAENAELKSENKGLKSKLLLLTR